MISVIEITKENFWRFQRDILEIERSSFPSPWSERGFKEEVDNPVSHFWGLLINGSLRGYACFWLFAGEIHLMNIAVHPGERAKGFGRQRPDGQ